MAPARTQSRSEKGGIINAGAVDEVKSRFQDVVHIVDAHLTQYPLVSQVAASVGVRPAWIPIAALAVLSMLFGVFDKLISSMIGFFYPAWQSFKAIESPSPTDDRQWLTYWVVYAFFSFVEIFGDFLLFWVPFYYLIKVALLLWLFLPQFKGASIVYAKIVRPLLLRYEGNIDEALDQMAGGGQKFLYDASGVGKELGKNK